MHYNYYRYGTIHCTYTIYTLQGPQNEREDAYHHEHRFLYMFTSCHVFTNTEYLYRQTAVAADFVGIISYTYHLCTMNYIVFTRSNEAQYRLRAMSTSKMTPKSKRPSPKLAIEILTCRTRRPLQ